MISFGNPSLGTTPRTTFLATPSAERTRSIWVVSISNRTQSSYCDRSPKPPRIVHRQSRSRSGLAVGRNESRLAGDFLYQIEMARVASVGGQVKSIQCVAIWQSRISSSRYLRLETSFPCPRIGWHIYVLSFRHRSAAVAVLRGLVGRQRTKLENSLRCVSCWTDFCRRPRCTRRCLRHTIPLWQDTQVHVPVRVRHCASRYREHFAVDSSHRVLGCRFF